MLEYSSPPFNDFVSHFELENESQVYPLEHYSSDTLASRKLTFVSILGNYLMPSFFSKLRLIPYNTVEVAGAISITER